tara:strand:+ start:5258 stop:6385 length:1128 start_codon:yes stop_codon:yes gene_type:complete
MQTKYNLLEPFILSIGTAVPEYISKQSEIFDKINKLCDIDPKRQRVFKEIFKKSAINNRHTVLEESEDFSGVAYLLQSEHSEKGLSIEDRNKIYIKEAPKLSLQAAKDALNQWGGDSSDITHVISISCTGMYAPGLEAYLQKNLNLSNNIDRLAINYMGCFGAFKGLSVAKSISQSNGKARILVVCTELCSLHVQATNEFEKFIPNALFADGAAAVIVGANPLDFEKPLWKIIKNYSEIIPETIDFMTWNISNYGFLMYLDRKVPNIIKTHANRFIENLLKGQNINNTDCEWPIHPGGRAIIEAIAGAVKIPTESLDSTYSVLSKYGNMSSATFLFVLKEILQKEHTSVKPWSIGIGFGPGLSFEGILLENYYAK